jgi:predicted ArsR family transcriptional regulator
MVNPASEQQLFWPPASHRNDPETSHEAEAVITQTGKRQTHATKVLGIVTAHPGLTTGAIGEISGLGQMETRKRLSDLKNRGLARQGQPRIWHGSGRQNVTWWPVEVIE